MIKRKIISYRYESTVDTKNDFQVESDFLNWRLYLEPPKNDNDFCSAEEFGKAILRAVKDSKIQMQKEG